jgi:hypothetical protein
MNEKEIPPAERRPTNDELVRWALATMPRHDRETLFRRVRDLAGKGLSPTRIAQSVGRDRNEVNMLLRLEPHEIAERYPGVDSHKLPHQVDLWFSKWARQHHGDKLPEVIYSDDVPPGWHTLSAPRCVAPDDHPHDCSTTPAKRGGYPHHDGYHVRFLVLPLAARGKPIPEHFLPKGRPPPRAPEADRLATATFVAVEKRTGLDGKKRKQPEKRRSRRLTASAKRQRWNRRSDA